VIAFQRLEGHHMQYPTTRETSITDIIKLTSLSPPRCGCIYKFAQIALRKGPIWIKLRDEWVAFELFRRWSLVGFDGQTLFVHEIVGG
jgi:hypothetical protein